MISENEILSGELYPYFQIKKMSNIYGIIFLSKPIDIDDYHISHIVFS
jgi:hypothetical protein